MHIFLAAEAQDLPEASPLGRPLLHLSYRIGPGGVLLSRSLPEGLRGGLLGLSDLQAPALPDPAALARAIGRECQRRQFNGVVLDFEEAPRPDLLALARCLSDLLPRSRRTLWGPSPWVEGLTGALPMVSAAISGGELGQYLRDAAARYQGRFVLEVPRLRMDFALPARDGTGVPLSPAQLQGLLDRLRPAVHFSQDLCVRYFSYLDGDRLHMVLFDDAATLKQKLQLARSLRCPAAVLLWPDVRELDLRQLLT